MRRSSGRGNQRLRALEVCVQGLHTGADLQQLLATYPQWADDLRPLAQAAQAGYAHAAALYDDLGTVEPALVHSRADFLQAAQRMLPRLGRAWLLRALRLGLAILALFAVLALGVREVDRLAGQSLPGQVLFPLKSVGEAARLALAQDTSQRLALERSFDGRRLADVKVLSEKLSGDALHGVDVEFTGGLSQVQGATENEWLVGGMRVVVASDAQMVGKIRSGYHVTVQGEMQADGSVLARRVQMREYTLVGGLELISVQHVVLQGVEIRLLPDTLVQGDLAAGPVRVTALLSNEQVLCARVVEVITADAE